MQKNTSSLTTDELARRLGIRPSTIREALCRHGGHYFGVKPLKRPNGRLMWPADSFERLTTGVEV